MTRSTTNQLQSAMQSKHEKRQGAYNVVEELSNKVKTVIDQTTSALAHGAEHRVVMSCITELMKVSAEVQHHLVQARLARRGHNETTVRALQDISSSIGRILRSTESFGALVMNEANNAL